MDDAALVLQARQGDTESFAAIYDRYGARLYGFLCSMLRDPDEAQDVLHDTFLAAGARLHQLRDPAKLRPWLYAIARHAALRRLDQRSRLEPLGETEVRAEDEVNAVQVDGQELVALVGEAAEGLSDRDRTVLELHLRQGLEGQDLADALGIKVGHAYVLMSRLRDQMERAVGALLVARQGRADCEELHTLLSGWDGRFSTVWRKRVARHVDGCDVCETLRSRAIAGLSAALAALPLPALSDGVRERLLEEVQLVSHAGPPFEGGRDGFPPSSPGFSRRPRWTGVAAAAAVLVLGLAVVAAVAGSANRPDSEEVSAASPPAGETTSTDPGTPAPPGPSDPALGPASPTASSTTAPNPAGSSAPSGPGSTGSTPSQEEDEEGGDADTTPPSLSALRIAPPAISAGLRCAPGDARAATASVRAEDPSGVAEVVLTRGAPVPGSSAMTNAGDGTWTASVGPFGDVVTPGRTVAMPLTVRATDEAGNTATVGGTLLLRCDSGP